MKFFSQLSLKTKLVYMLLGVSLGCILVIGYQGLTHGKQEITRKVYDQLTSVRATTGAEIERYFERVRAELKSLAENHSTVGAMREFDSAFSRFKDETISDGMLSSLKGYYSQEYFPNLINNVGGELSLDFYVPDTPAGQYLQYQYITGNKQARGEKDALIQANDQSYYSGVHNYYHPVFRNHAKNSGFRDLFLISIKSGDIVYSVNKETDFATNLLSGPYSNSNLAKLFQKVKASQDKGDVQIQDLEFYRPSYNKAYGFIGTIIYDGNTPVGVLAVKLPQGENLNASLGENGGMGDTGEVIIVGKDKLMRNNARSLTETVDCYRASGTDASTNKITERICRNFNSVLLQDVDNRAVFEAQHGKSGTAIVRSYNGDKVLSSYGPLNIDGLDWVMLAQMEVAEANEPVYAFQRDLTLATALLGCLVTFLAMFLSNVFTRPVNQLMEGVKRLGEGDMDVTIDLNRKDEFGQLADTFNKTVDLIRQQNKTIQEKEAENESLLRNILPDAVARRVQKGDQEIADRVESVSVLFSSIKGFTQYAESISPKDAVKQLNHLVNAFDGAADNQGVEKVKTIGDSYMACCGLTIPRIDHAKRMVSYAKEMVNIVDRFNIENGTSLGIRIGIHSGPVIAGIVGKNRFVYDLWGDSVNVASRIRFEAPANCILVTNTVYERLNNQTGFRQMNEINTIGMGTIDMWQWSAKEQELSQQDTQVIERPQMDEASVNE